MQKYSTTIKICISLVMAASFITFNDAAFAASSQNALEAAREVISNPTGETVYAFVKTMQKEYKKANRAGRYDEAADYLRAALYFLKQDTASVEYNETASKLRALLVKMGVNNSKEERLELAKSLYLEDKLFASAYEFSMLLKEEYEIDLCYEYLGDIARRLESEDVAFAFYKKSVDVNPENLNAKYKYAKGLLRKGQADDASFYIEEIIESTNSEGIINEIINLYTDRINANPNDENNYGVLGLAYQKQGEYNKTYQLLKKSLAINPNDVFLQYYLGNLLFDIQEYSLANEIYTEILEDNPYESQIRISRAKTYIAMNKNDKAIKDFQVVLAMYPDSMQAQYGIYSILKEKEPLDAIISRFYPLEEEYQLTDEGYNDLGYFANKKGSSLDAISFFEKSLAINPNSETPYIELYRLYQLLGMDEKARGIIKDAYAIFPTNMEVAQMFGAVSTDNVDEKFDVALSYLNEGEYQKAIAVYEQIEVKTFDVYNAIGNCYRQLGDLKNAVISYKKAIELNPNNSEVYYSLGTTYLEANNLLKAKEAFNLSLKKDPKNIKSKKMIAYLEQREITERLDEAYEFYERQDYQGALVYLDRALMSFPNDAKIYFYRALTKDALGDFNGAINDFKKTVALDKSYSEAYFRLAETMEKADMPKDALYMYEKYLGAENIDPALAKAAEERVLHLGEDFY